MHPAAWLVWAGAAGVVALSTTNPFYLLPLLGCAWAVHVVHARRDPMARSFRVFLIAGAVTLFTRTLLVLLGPVTAGSVVTAVLEGTRLAVMLAVFGAFNSVADPFGVLRLAPRRLHEPALAAALSLSIAPRMIFAVQRVREAQRMRGLEPGRLRAIPALAVPVLETGMEEALTLAESMDARGHGRGPRTRYRPQPVDAAAIVVVMLSLLAATAAVARVLAGGGDLVMSAFPVAWPEVTWAGLSSVLALSAPVFVRPRAS